MDMPKTSYRCCIVGHTTEFNNTTWPQNNFSFFRTNRQTKMAALAPDWLGHFQLPLCNRWMEFDETWSKESTTRRGSRNFRQGGGSNLPKKNLISKKKKTKKTKKNKNKKHNRVEGGRFSIYSALVRSIHVSNLAIELAFKIILFS